MCGLKWLDVLRNGGQAFTTDPSPCLFLMSVLHNFSFHSCAFKFYDTELFYWLVVFFFGGMSGSEDIPVVV